MLSELEKAKLLAAAHKLTLSEISKLRNELLEEISYPLIPENEQYLTIGAPGEPGKDGRDGIDGVAGPKGDNGQDGHSITEARLENGHLIVSIDTGDSFDLGYIIGEQGEQGIPGPIGERGPKGDKGDRGEKGAKGDKGDRGEQGSAGKDGVNGKDGRDGIDGKDGRDGVDGKDGVAGAPGVKGPRGDKGDQGKQGIPGPKGDRGEKGEPGERGADGKDGKDGKDGDTPDIKPLQEKILKDLKEYKKSVSDQVTKSLKLAGSGSSGGGEVRLLRLDDVDTRNLANNAFIKYDASTSKLVFTNVIPGGGVTDFAGLTGTIASSQVPQGSINVSKFINNAGYANTQQLSRYLQVANSNISNWDTAYGWGNHASAGYLSGTISSLTNGADTLSLNGSNKVDLPGGTAYIFSATNNVTLSADLSGDNILEIINNIGATLYTDRSFEIRTNKGISDKTFTFTQSGGLTFPDATTQTTAWSNNALKPYITVANTNAKFATKAYAASNTYVQRYLQVANSTSFITSSALTPYLSVANSNAKFATKAYASSNTYVNTQLNKYLQVANSSVSNWNTAYGWGNHASVGYLTSVSWSQVTDKPANILTLNDVNVVSNDMLVNDSITIGSTAVALGQNITTLTGLTGVTSNAATAFIAGTAAESGVALQMPREGAIRNMTNGDNTMYFDVSNGGTTHGNFNFRSSSNFTSLLHLSSTRATFGSGLDINGQTPYVGRTSFNVALDTVVTVDNIKYRISNQGGVFPQIASASGSSVDVCYDVLGVVSGAGTTNAQNTGYILASNGTWLSIYSAHGMDNRGDRLTAHITDKAAGKIYRVTFLVTNNSGNTTGYNIIVERIL